MRKQSSVISRQSKVAAPAAVIALLFGHAAYACDRPAYVNYDMPVCSRIGSMCDPKCDAISKEIMNSKNGYWVGELNYLKGKFSSGRTKSNVNKKTRENMK